MKANYKSVVLLLFASAIWGFAFVAQDIASQYLSSFTINGVRSILGFIFLFIMALVKSLIKKKKYLNKIKIKGKH